jgi:hypothetical protein
MQFVAILAVFFIRTNIKIGTIQKTNQMELIMRALILSVFLIVCPVVVSQANCVAELQGNFLCHPGDTAYVPGETGRYRRCMAKRVLTSAGNPLSASHYTCGGGEWVYISDNHYQCELPPRGTCR